MKITLTIIFTLVLILTTLDLYSINRLRSFPEDLCIDDSMAYEKPTLEQSNIYQGQSLIKQKKFSEAINYFTKAIEINPDFALTYLWLGDSYAQQNNLIQATLNYTKASLIYITNPNNYRCVRD